jgi:hypothetical protein
MEINKFTKKVLPDIEYSIDVNLMDIKNISKLIVNYLIDKRDIYEVKYGVNPKRNNIEEDEIYDIEHDNLRYTYIMYILARDEDESIENMKKYLLEYKLQKELNNNLLEINKIKDLNLHVNEAKVLCFYSKHNSLLLPHIKYYINNNTSLCSISKNIKKEINSKRKYY